MLVGLITPIFFGGFSAGSRAEIGANTLDKPENSKAKPQSQSTELIEEKSSEGIFPLKAFQLEADNQIYDTRKNIFIAEGNVKLVINGAFLRADQIEFNRLSQSIRAKGSVRFSKGSNYFQASSFQYNLEKKTGELNDVYGVLDLDNALFDFLLEEANPSDVELKKDLSSPPLQSKDFKEASQEDLGMACPPNIPQLPDWQPHPWGITAWGGQMIDSSFGDAFVFKGRKRPEYLFGIGLQKRIYRSGIFSLELEADAFRHQALKQSGGKFNQSVPYADSPAQNFSEGILGIGARIWVQPWLSFALVEGISYYTELGSYEKTFREKAGQLLNYLGFEIEASINRRLSLVGRLHHRSGAFGLYNGVHGGGNGYIAGFRYRWGKDKVKRPNYQIKPPIGCRTSNTNVEAKEEISPLNILQEKELTKSEDISGINSSDSSYERSTESLKITSRTLSRGEEEVRRAKYISSINQRIDSLELQKSLTVEKRFGVPEALRNLDDKNVYGGIKPPQLTSIGNTKFIKGRITRWRVQASKVLITEDGWKAERMAFSNDPYTPAQTMVEAEDVIAEEQKDGSTIIKTGSNRLVLEQRLSIPVSRRHKVEKVEEVENWWVLGIDREDRDGFYVGRNLKPIKLTENYSLSLQPQFNFQRALDGKTKSYIAPGSSSESDEIRQSSEFSDLFGLEAILDGKIFDWNLQSNADISTFNSTNFLNGSRYWGGLTKNSTLPIIGNFDTRLFSAYRYRAWNGSLGETNIYSAIGAFLQKKGDWEFGNSKNNYLFRVGLGNYQAENYRSESLSDLWRGNIYGSMTSIYELIAGQMAPLDSQNAYRYSPVAIKPGLSFNTNINFSFSAYGDGRKQSTFGLSGGPTLTLGTFTKKFFDYTRFSLTTGGTFKQGSSPFSFDQAIDLGTLGLGITQQIYGALVVDAGFEYNIDPASSNYGEMINSNVEFRIQRRAYDFGIYYNPYKKIGGFRIRLNDFNFNGTGIPFIPNTSENEKENENRVF